MSTIDDLLTAINGYPNEHVELRVINFKEPGTHINVGEICTFNVRVENNSVLDMKSLKLHVRGTRYASVGRFPYFFVESFISEGRTVDAHASVTFGPFWMRAGGATPDGGTSNEDLFSVHISLYDASLHHILYDHSHHAAAPEFNYNRHIHPA